MSGAERWQRSLGLPKNSGCCDRNRLLPWLHCEAMSRIVSLMYRESVNYFPIGAAVNGRQLPWPTIHEPLRPSRFFTSVEIFLRASKEEVARSEAHLHGPALLIQPRPFRASRGRLCLPTTEVPPPGLR